MGKTVSRIYLLKNLNDTEKNYAQIDQRSPCTHFLVCKEIQSIPLYLLKSLNDTEKNYAQIE